MIVNEVRDILYPFSVLYGGVVSMRNFGYDHGLLEVKKLPLPVISVGNIAVGGSGKTPFVIFLIEKVLSFGKRPAVLSRGYKRLSDDMIISCPEKGSEVDVQLLGDEPALISQMYPGVPVAVHKNRYRAGLAVLEKYSAEVILLDDGLQNRELYRDADFVLLKDSLEDLKDSYLPAGNLRDSRRRIRQANIIIVTSHGDLRPSHSDLELIGKYSEAPVAGVRFVQSHFLDHAGVVHPLSELSGKEITVFCGIANPRQFFSAVEQLDAKIVSRKSFCDHHWFDEYDIDEIFGGDEDLIAVTTAKDAVRIFLDDELSRKEEVSRIYALQEKAVVSFGEEYIDSVLTKAIGEVRA